MTVRDDIAATCWALTGVGPETLDERSDRGLDPVVREHRAGTTFAYRGGRFHYLIAECGGGDGLKLAAVWDDRDHDGF